jgi:hypothetical protein
MFHGQPVTTNDRFPSEDARLERYPREYLGVVHTEFLPPPCTKSSVALSLSSHSALLFGKSGLVRYVGVMPALNYCPIWAGHPGLA